MCVQVYGRAPVSACEQPAVWTHCVGVPVRVCGHVDRPALCPCGCLTHTPYGWWCMVVHGWLGASL